MLKSFLKKILKKFGFQLVPAGKNERMSFDGVMGYLAGATHPKIVIDVGAAYGDFSLRLHPFFPDATYILCEPLLEYLPILEKREKEYGFHIIKEAVGDSVGKVNFFVHDDMVGSSLKRESEGSHVDGQSREVSMTTLDHIKAQHHLDGSVFLKVDVQGAELDVLRGATNVLALCDVVVLEVSFFRSMIGGSDVAQVVAFMKEKGFVIYDILGLLYRPYDRALVQADMVFIPERSALRKFQGYATKEQREIQTKRFQEKHYRILHTQ